MDILTRITEGALAVCTPPPSQLYYVVEVVVEVVVRKVVVWEAWMMKRRWREKEGCWVGHFHT